MNKIQSHLTGVSSFIQRHLLKSAEAAQKARSRNVHITQAQRNRTDNFIKDVWGSRDVNQTREGTIRKALFGYLINPQKRNGELERMSNQLFPNDGVSVTYNDWKANIQQNAEQYGVPRDKFGKLNHRDTLSLFNFLHQQNPIKYSFQAMRQNIINAQVPNNPVFSGFAISVASTSYLKSVPPSVAFSILRGNPNYTTQSKVTDVAWLDNRGQPNQHLFIPNFVTKQFFPFQMTRVQNDNGAFNVGVGIDNVISPTFLNVADNIMRKIYQNRRANDNSPIKFQFRVNRAIAGGFNRSFVITIPMTGAQFNHLMAGYPNQPQQRAAAFRTFWTNSFKEWRTNIAAEREGIYDDGEEGEEFFNDLFIDQMNIYERREDTDPYITDVLEDDDFDYLAYCRSDTSWKSGLEPVMASVTDAGICLYECFFYIKFEELMPQIKKFSAQEFEEAIYDTFYQETDEMQEAVLMGNPMKFFQEAQMQGYSNFSIFFYENLEIDLMKVKNPQYIILIRKAHASLHFASEWESKKHVIMRGAQMTSRMKAGQTFDCDSGNPNLFVLKPLEGEKQKQLNKSERKIKNDKKNKKNLKFKLENPISHEQLKVAGQLVQPILQSMQNEDEEISYKSIFIKMPQELGMLKSFDVLKDTAEIFKLGLNVNLFKEKKKKFKCVGNEGVMVKFENLTHYGVKFDVNEFKGEDVIKMNMDIDEHLKDKFTRDPNDPNSVELVFDFETVAVNGIFFIYCWCVVNLHNFNQRLWYYGIENSRDTFIKFIESIVDVKMESDLYKKKHKKPNVTQFHLWSFNGGRFDCQFFASYFLKYYKVDLIGELKSIKKMTINRNVHFHDLKLIFTRGKLSEVGASFGKPEYQKKELDHNRVNSVNYLNYFLETLEYCFYDCFCLASCVHKLYELCDEFDVTHYPFSGADLTMKIFRTQFYSPTKSNNWFITGLDDATYVNVSKSYYGGQCCAFKREFKPIDPTKRLHYLDICSSYPKIMRDYSIPYKVLSSQYFKQTFTYQNYNNEDYRIVPHALYQIQGFEFNDDILYPFIPEKDSAGLLWYPLRSNAVTWVWGHTLIFGFDNRCWKKDIVSHVMINFYADKIFYKFVNTLFERRNLVKKETKEALKIKDYQKARELTAVSDFLKLLLNSLYGKFGQKIFEEKHIFTHDQMKYLSFLNGKAKFIKKANPVRNDTKIRMLLENDFEITDFDKRLKMMSFYEEDTELFVVTLSGNEREQTIGKCKHLASFITSMARLRLNEGIYAVTKQGRELNVYYCDTDSIVADLSNNPMPPELLGEELGQWKVEHMVKEGIFIAPKMYAIQCETDDPNEQLVMKCKGIYKKVLKYEMFQKILNENWVEIDIGGVFKRIAGGVKIENTVKFLRDSPRRQWLSNGDSIPALGVNKWKLPENDEKLLKRKPINRKQMQTPDEKQEEDEEKPNFLITIDEVTIGDNFDPATGKRIMDIVCSKDNIAIDDDADEEDLDYYLNHAYNFDNEDDI